ncbi:MAG: membrane integrity-associated transporter subunit PqiC, partial [Candidatus Cloacimonetes bacterium]|nr:membrane integrity-associated transporter subunit PqiC [Candidatus Cloacimonadota bacterium]
MNKLGILFFGTLFIFLLGCSAGELISPNYYILEYYQHSEKEELRQETPLDLSVYVYDTKIPKIYNKNQIVIRHFGPRITYSNYDLWGVKLSKTIPDLISKRLNSYNIFKRTQREILDTRADFEIITNLNNIELVKSETVQLARLNIDFVFRKSERADILVKHSVNIEKTLLSEDMDTFVQVINDVLLKETDNFIRKIILYSAMDTEAVLPSIITREEVEPLIFEISEEEEISSGKGLLLLPAITRTDNEPSYTIIDKYGYEQSGQIGTAIPLLEGIYSIKYGSGLANQLMEQDNIKIVPRYKTIIEPDWGCLIVDIMDEKRNFAKVRYEVFDLEKGESFGSDFPAEEEVGEQEKIWVLKPGRYKVTVNNEPFNTYRDFTTVFVKKGKVQKLTIVMKT